MKAAGCILVLASAAAAPAQLPPALDTIFLKRGDPLAGEVVGIDAQSVRFKKPLPAQPGATAPVFATVTVPREGIDLIEFAPDDARQQMLASATVAQLADVEAFWREAQPWLAFPKSPAGAIGLAYGELLLRSRKVANARKALALFKVIEKDAWRDEDKMAARHGRLRAMVATGHAQDAVSEATELARVSEDPAVLIEAKFLLASAADKALRELVEDNPRWTEDAFVIPKRNRLYNEALDLYLFPALFFGSDADAAARGLWGAAGVHRAAGEIPHAVELARDLVAMYPATEFAAQARKFLDGLPPEARQQDNEKEAREDLAAQPEKNEK